MKPTQTKSINNYAPFRAAIENYDRAADNWRADENTQPVRYKKQQDKYLRRHDEMIKVIDTFCAGRMAAALSAPKEAKVKLPKKRRAVLLSQQYRRYCVDFCRKGGYTTHDSHIFHTLWELVEALPGLFLEIKATGEYTSLQICGMAIEDGKDVRDVLGSISLITKKGKHLLPDTYTRAILHR